MFIDILGVLMLIEIGCCMDGVVCFWVWSVNVEGEGIWFDDL